MRNRIYIENPVTALSHLIWKISNQIQNMYDYIPGQPVEEGGEDPDVLVVGVALNQTLDQERRAKGGRQLKNFSDCFDPPHSRLPPHQLWKVIKRELILQNHHYFLKYALTPRTKISVYGFFSSINIFPKLSVIAADLVFGGACLSGRGTGQRRYSGRTHAVRLTLLVVEGIGGVDGLNAALEEVQLEEGLRQLLLWLEGGARHQPSLRESVAIITCL